MSEKKPPVAVGEEHAAIVDNVGEKGDGILRVYGFVVFVPGVSKGDFVKVRITKVLAKVAFAELVEKMNPAQRLKPKKEEIDPEIEKLLTTENDSEDFGEDDEEEDL